MLETNKLSPRFTFLGVLCVLVVEWFFTGLNYAEAF